MRTTPVLGWLTGLRGAGAWTLAGWPEPGWHATLLVSLPSWMVATCCVVRTLGWIALTVGFHARVAGIFAAVAEAIVVSQDLFGLTSTAHLLVVGTLVLAVADSSAAFAVRRASEAFDERGVTLIRIVLASVYGWAAIAKLHASWLDGRVLEILAREGRLAQLGLSLAGTAHRRALAAPAIVVVEAALAATLLLPGRVARWLGIAAALAFHGALEIAVEPDVFGWAMAALLVGVIPARDGGSHEEIDGRAWRSATVGTAR